jgi:hypothetical protein
MQFRWRRPFYVTLFLTESWETWCFAKIATPKQRLVGRGDYILPGNAYPFSV